MNNEKVENILNRSFNNNQRFDALVSDLTYVNVNGSWNYICFIIDIFNREIVGYSAGKNKDAALVNKAFSVIETNLSNVGIFHTDRGSEFKNQSIDNLLSTFSITRSLSKKGCPHDNAVAEATFKIVKTEFTYSRIFANFEELESELFDYVNWFNNFRIHGSLNYLSPVNFRSLTT